MENLQSNTPFGDTNRARSLRKLGVPPLFSSNQKPLLPPFSLVRKNSDLHLETESLDAKKSSDSRTEKLQQDLSDSELSLPEHLKIKFNHGNMVKSLHHSLQFPLKSDSSDDDIDVAIRRMKYRLEMDYLTTKLQIPSSGVYDYREQASDIEDRPRWIRAPDWEEKLMKDPPKTWHDKREDKHIYTFVAGRSKNNSEKVPLPFSPEWEENLLKPRIEKPSTYQRRIEKREQKLFSAWQDFKDKAEHPIKKIEINENKNVKYQNDESNNLSPRENTQSKKTEIRQGHSANIPEQNKSGKSLLEQNYRHLPREVDQSPSKVHKGVNLGTKPPPRGPKFTYDGIIHTVKPKMPLPRGFLHSRQSQPPPSRVGQVSEFPNLEHHRPPKPRSMKPKDALYLKQKKTKEGGKTSMHRGYRRPRPSTGVKNCQAAAEAAVRSYLTRRGPNKLAPGAPKQLPIHEKPKTSHSFRAPGQMKPKQNSFNKPKKPALVKSLPARKDKNDLVSDNQISPKTLLPISQKEAISAKNTKYPQAAQNKNQAPQQRQHLKYRKGLWTVNAKSKAADTLRVPPPPMPSRDTKFINKSYDWDQLEPPPFVPPPEKKEIVRRGRKTYDWVLPQHESKPYTVRKPSFIDTTPEFHPYYNDMKKDKEKKPLSPKEILAQEECFQKIDKTLNEYIKYKAMRDARNIPFVANNEPFPKVSCAARLCRKSSKIKSKKAENWEDEED